MLQENVNKMDHLTQRFYSQYSTHVQGDILDLVFDSRKLENVLWIPSLYIDHFRFCIDF